MIADEHLKQSPLLCDTPYYPTAPSREDAEAIVALHNAFPRLVALARAALGATP